MKIEVDKKPWRNLEVEINNDKNNYCPTPLAHSSPT